MKSAPLVIAILAALALPACASLPKTGPVEVTRFHQAAAMPQLGQGTIFVETAPGQDSDGTDLSLYKSAVAAQLTRLGYRETPRAEAAQIAQVRVRRYISQPAERRRPVSVGGGGSVGSYGSGVGLGIGINLGGGQREMIGTDLSVMIRNTATGTVIWEGRAALSVSDNSDLADSGANASAIADAMFREFPGNNGETVHIRAAN